MFNLFFEFRFWFTVYSFVLLLLLLNCEFCIVHAHNNAELMNFIFFIPGNFINGTEPKKTKPNTLRDKMAMQAQLTEKRRSNTQAQNTKIKPSRKQATTRHLPRVRSPGDQWTRVKTRNHFLPPEPEEATELRRRRRRTTEEPIFTRARTEEPKLVDLRIGKRTSTPTIDHTSSTILHERIRHLWRYR